jgi:hypothetical protein
VLLQQNAIQEQLALLQMLTEEAKLHSPTGEQMQGPEEEHVEQYAYGLPCVSWQEVVCHQVAMHPMVDAGAARGGSTQHMPALLVLTTRQRPMPAAVSQWWLLECSS